MNYEVLIERAVVAIQQSRPDVAEQALQQAIGLEPGYLNMDGMTELWTRYRGSFGNLVAHALVARDLPANFDRSRQHAVSGLKWLRGKARPDHKTIGLWLA